MPELHPIAPDSPARLGAAALSEAMAEGSLTSEALVTACLDRIAARDPEVHAWDYLDPDHALAQARARDAEPRRSPLHGIPVGIKDIFDTFDMPTAYGSPIYASHVPATDTALVALLRMAGAVILGKAATTEFASPVLKHTRNPHDTRRSPGVSSSGSAAAVADFHVPLALGSQTGGSTILPASFCGVLGYKASLTGLDRGGIRHLRPTLDTVGLFARSLPDLVLLRAALVGAPAAPSDASFDRPPRIGVCRTPGWLKAEPHTRTSINAAASALARGGASVSEADLPPVFEGIEQSFRVISSLEGSRALRAEIAEHPGRLNAYIQAAAQKAETVDQAACDKAHLHAIECRRALAGIFEHVDVLITPAAPGEAASDLESISDSVFNRTWTLMHGPAVSLPLFEGPAGLPVGLQVVGPVGADDRTLAAAAWIWNLLAVGESS